MAMVMMREMAVPLGRRSGGWMNDDGDGDDERGG